MSVPQPGLPGALGLSLWLLKPVVLAGRSQLIETLLIMGKERREPGLGTEVLGEMREVLDSCGPTLSRPVCSLSALGTVRSSECLISRVWALQIG